MAQTGKFRNGTYGYPVIVRLSARENISLALVTAIWLTVLKPDQAPVIVYRSLALSAITDATVGIIQWIVQDGDLPVRGTYAMTLTIDSGPNQRLIVDGRFSVE